MQITPLPAFHDNYIWVIQDNAGNALVVDPGDANPVIAHLEAHALKLRGLLITHHHPDHVGGVQALHDHYGMPVYGPSGETIPCMTHPLDDGDRLQLDAPALAFDVLHVPGHTLGHIAFYTSQLSPPALFCGDTLFIAGCGRLFEGTPAQMLASLDRLATLPDDTRVCCAHEYTLSNLAFARAVTPDDPAVLARSGACETLRQAGKPTVPGSIGEEKRSNPFLRSADPAIKIGLERAGHPADDRLTAFTSLRTWKDEF